MSSEEKSLEPSDKGPSPPPSSSGATPTGSPAPTDKRPRGRPRKDALSTAPPLPSVSRQRKKNRGRGKALVEDEDSTDGMETAETGSTQETVTKGQPEEMEGATAVAVPGGGEEEEQSSSPLPARCETGAAQTSSAFGEAKSSEQLCALCYCGGRSLLGQGDLKPFRVTPGNDPPLHQQSSTEEGQDHEDKSKAASQPGRHRGPESVVAEDSSGRFSDELHHVGLPDDIDFRSLFDESGQCWAHQSCVLWSNFVCQAEDQSLLNVDKAIHSGSTEHCAYCKRLGASIKCCEEGCDRSYHYPCAGATGTFQDFRRRSVLCTEHIQLAVSKYEEEANCVLCDSPGDLLDQLFCTSCGLHYHGMCLDISVTPLKRAGWQCPECKVCQTCKELGEDTKMLVCDMCDKGYHTYCLQPAMDSIPTNGWRCKNCRMCVQCGTRSSEQWHHNSLLCQNCADQQDTSLSCLCSADVDPDVHKEPLTCRHCKRWFHPECEQPVEGHARAQSKEDHLCSICTNAGFESGSACMVVEATQEEIQSHVDVKEDAKPVSSKEDPEPPKVEESLQLDSEMQSEEAKTSEEQVTEIGADATSDAAEPESRTEQNSTDNERASVTSPQETTLPEDSESRQQKLDSAPETSTVQQLMTSTETEKPPEMSTKLSENISQHEDDSKSCQEVLETNQSPTKEPTPASASHEEEPMEVSFTEEASTKAHGVCVDPGVTAAKTSAGVQKVEEEKMEVVVRKHDTIAVSHTEEMDINSDEQSLAKLSSLVEERTMFKQSPCRQPEGLPLFSQVASQPQLLPQIHAGPAEAISNVPSSTFIPLTPKIGMGKPAISKRKFSPGRPRVKQGAWSISRRLSSPSWSLDPTEGWDGPKSRQPYSSAAWIICVGRGSSFPGRRRPRGSGVTGRGGRGRGRMKNGVPPIPTPGVSAMETVCTFREEDENAMHNTVVIFSSTDTFTIKQDMCVVCGSFGQGVEGRLLACAQCGQCYHPYCVNIKITKVVLSKGWRCLECTVCEACGQASDPGRLLLCDDCDISYHTYCLDPPLQNVPNGSWKCKWCVSCTQCGATSAGLRCEWQNNYTQCAPCASLATCSLCQQDYREEDIILQCRQCDRWVHASCQGVHSEEEVEKIAESSFDCSLCQGHAPLSPALGTPAISVMELMEPVLMPQRIPKTRDHPGTDLTRTYTQDGVCLTESGLSQLQSLANAASRRRRSKPKLKLKIINQNSVAVLQTPPDPQTEASRNGNLEDIKTSAAERDMVDGEVKSDSSPEREATVEDDTKDTDPCKKRKRKPYRPGIGGFMVRQRNRTGPGRTKPAPSRKDSTGSENLQGKDESWGDQAPDTPIDEKHCLSDLPDFPEVKIRKRYRKKKTKLEEAFPTYLQEAFFGKDLLDKSKQSRQETTRLLEDERDRKQLTANQMKRLSNSSLGASSALLTSKAVAAQNSAEPLVEMSEVLKSDTELLGMFSDNIGKQTEQSGLDFCPFQVDYSPSSFGLDIAPLTDEASGSYQTHLGRSHPRQTPEPLDGILSPELDKMVTDESILGRLYKIPELGGKDVEDLFTAVLSPSVMPQQIQGAQSLHGPGLHPSQTNSGLLGALDECYGMAARMPMMNGLMETKPFSQSQMGPGAGPDMTRNIPPMQRMPFPDNLRDRKFNLMAQETAGPWSATGSSSASAPIASPEMEGDAMSTAQKSTLKWEKEETLGELATVAPVLYTNVNFPNLKEEYPDWSTRVKQIAKLWRKASSQDRAPYVQKARDNRAALRINKVQMSNETIKREPPQPQQPLEVFDPAIPPLDPELLFKDPLKHKESEHEQEWKYRQQMRQKSKQQAKIEATQKLEQVKNEQLQQQQQQHPSLNQSEDDSPGSLRSPVSVHSNNGNMSPKQSNSNNGGLKPQMPGTPTSCSPDDVFLRPHPPPPSSGSQPQSPQMFSPSSSGSRPSSPWDPYNKMVGTPRPSPSGQGTPRHNSESGKSPRGLSEPIGSPTSICNDPYAKPPDTPRPAGNTDTFLKPMCPPRASQTLDGRHLIGSPGHDPFSRVSMRKEAYQRMPQGRMILSDPYARPLLTPIPGSNESGSIQVFKTPMPPPQAQEQFAGMQARRVSGDSFERPMMPLRSAEGFSQNQLSDPYAQPALTPRPAGSEGYANQRVSRQPQTLPFSQPGPIVRQPPCNPYARSPSTPRPDFSQCDPYGQQPATPRPSNDPFGQSPFSNPYARMPGTPRPHDPEPYSQQHVSRHPVMMNQPTPQSQQQTQNSIMSPMSMDPYAHPPGTTRSGMPDRFPKSPSHQRNPDPFSQPAGLQRSVGPDLHAQAMGRSQSLPNDSCVHPPRTPHPGGSRQAMGPGPMSSQDPFSPPQVLMQDTFASPTKHGPQTLKYLGMTDDAVSQPLSSRPNHTPIHDPFEQAPMIPHPQCAENKGLVQSMNSHTMGQPGTEAQSVPLAEAEERLRQRQHIRELILRQQQQKSAIRQEKNVQDHPLTMPPRTPQHWSQEATNQQGDIFNQPPPPYPGAVAVRGAQRFHGPYPGDQQGHFPEGQFFRLQFPVDTDSTIRQPGPGMAITPGVQGSLGASRPHHMQEQIMVAHPQMRRSVSIDLGKSMGGGPIGTPNLPPHGMHVQQHNIMGQTFIELRHRAPDNRLRLPFGPPVMQGNRMESPSQQRPSGFMGGQDMGFPFNQVPKPMDTTMNQSQVAVTQMQGSLSMGNLHQANVSLRAGHPQIPLMRSISQPASNETLSAPLLTNVASGLNDEVPLSTNEGPEEKIDTDESAVKDFEDVEVKDLVDADLENLNLDPDDGKDLDLETNDLHLDDFLTSGKFDIIAYADADLDLSEDLDLSDPMEDHTELSDVQKHKTEKKTESFGDTPSSSCSASTVKDGIGADSKSQDHNQEVPQDLGLISLKTEEDSKTGIKDCMSQDTSCKDQVIESSSLEVAKTGIHPDSTPVLSSLLVNVPPEGGAMKQEHCGQSVTQSDPTNQEATVPLGSTLPGQGNFSVQGLESSLSLDQSLVSSHGESTLEVPGSIQEQPQSHIFGMDQKDALLSGEQHSILTQQEMLSQQGHQNRPLLLEEQPLLLQDLLDQERQEQQQQKQMQAMIRQRSNESFFPNIDFDSITDPIMKAKMVALKGINKMMVQNNMGMSPMAMNSVQTGQGPQGPDGAVPPVQVPGQDNKVAPHMARPNPPNFETGFVHDDQKVQYEDWLKETQHLLQMQQKFLEEQIGAHRKSKKALSAKQRTAKKAGREFPEEDAEQLKHVTEQQGMVQKQLEQIRKQQKEHAELIEEYRVKQQQQGGMQPQMMPGMPPMQPQAGMTPVGPPMNQPMMNPMMPARLHPGQMDAPNVPNTSGWHPGAPVPSGGPQMPGVMPSQVVQAQATPQPVARPIQGQTDGESPHVNFDDTNPFSEGFQERERKERLREQQERQRVQLMKEVERQRLKQCMVMEQQQVPNCEDGNMRALSQMPFYNQTELLPDFMQPPRMQQQMQGPAFPQQQGMQPGFSGGPSRPMMGNGLFHQEMGPGFVSENLAPHGPNFVQMQSRPQRYPRPNMMHQNPSQGHPFSMEGPTPLPPNFPGSGPSLIQLYSNIIPEEKGKKKRNRKKKKDDDCETLRAPSTPHSDLTAPLTPCVSDTSSTPTRNPIVFSEHELCEMSQPGSSTPGSMCSQPHSELERQLSEGSCGGGVEMGHQEMHDRILSNIKLEKVEASDCHGHKGMEMAIGMGMVKVEGDREGMFSHSASQSPANSSKGEAGNELLKHLLKNKRTPPHVLPHQRSEDSLRSEEDGSMDSKALLRQSSMDSTGTFSDSNFPGPLLSEDKKKQRNKRLPKSGDRPAPRCKKRKKEEDESQALYSSTEPVMTQLKQLSLLPLMEPLVGVNFAHFMPYGGGQLDGESRLSGTFGSASLDGVSDYYSQLIYKQNNLSNPPTPPASLPPTPPPVPRQKLLNGFATTEELAGKGGVIAGHDITKGLLSRPLQIKAEEELLARALAQGPKTVNVPASLPTPPHNNQEDLRSQEHCEDRDTPDSFVPSSSPESVIGMEISRYPDLSLVKEEPPSPAVSPVIPMFPVFRGKGSEVRLREVKTEPSSMFFGSSFGSVQNGSNTGLVSIAITLKPAAVENITDVVAAIADLIRVKIPSSYEVSSGPGNMGAIKTSVEPQSPASALQQPNGPGPTRLGPKQLQLQQNHNKSPVDGRGQYKRGRGSPGQKHQWCGHCKVVVLGNGVRKAAKDEHGKSQSQLSSDGGLVFCSHSCLILHSSSSQSNGNTEPKTSVALLSESALKQSPSKVQHQYNNNMSSLDVHCLAQLQPKPSFIHMVYTPAEPTQAIKTESKSESISESHLKVTVKLKPRLLNLTEDKPWHHSKRWKGLRWRKWTVQIVMPKSTAQTSESEMEELLRQLNSSLLPCSTIRDYRRCCFCQQVGDGLTDGPARLLNLDLDTWVHLNCALWSSEVYETQAGALINVELARQRGQTVVCAFCQRLGATSGCHRLRCLNIYHFTCALQAGCTFFKDKTMLCHQHRPRGAGAATGLHLEQQLRCFSVFRRVFVQRDELRQLAAAVQQPERGHTFRVGSLLFHTMGQLPQALLPTFHSSIAIFPPGYEASRLYWSMRHCQKRCRYVCSVEEHEGRPEFSIRVIEQGYEDLVLTDTTAKGVWNKVLGPVAERRAETGMLRLFPVYLKGEDLFGLTISAVTRIAESLPGVEACSRYRFRYGRNPMLMLPLSINPSGSARSELQTFPHYEKVKILSVWSRTSHCIQNTIMESRSSHSKHFVHSKSSQYRRLTSEWKSNVYLAHSRIQGLGLFAARDIEKQTMVIEYMGDVLRTEVAMRKELLYKAMNRQAYMFRINSDQVIDATRSGSPARYINHSCSPNCVAEVVTFERGYKIIINAARRIEKGEELCYDYKLALVEDQSKIPCHCGAANCRKWIN
ncbi:histone-lysine N-methyltransferase 2C isoform X3 [Triplophysa rosa]|uniref:histone-lysine N-methyltransferase 2C isoform X3 n=1 Tax=Triplophysa rosa TaxID=992332 RepID=UPI002545EBC0|nr:histone-lysine N-methyltransferase 2C isoform X3 [Triplophysa rosa]